MRRYVLRRLLQMIPVVLSVIVINFVLIQLAPGDVSLYLAGQEAGPEYIAAIRHEYGLDKPMIEQFWAYFSKVCQGDMGKSFVYGRPVIQVIAQRMPATILLILFGMGVAAVIGTLIGAYSAKRLGSPADTAISLLGITAYSIPVFWLGLMLILAFSVTLHWLPSSGIRSVVLEGGFAVRASDLIRHLVLPATTLGLVYVGEYIRLSRASVAEVMGEDFVTTSRAVGYDENTIFLKHVLRNALLPVVTIAGLQLGFVFAGATLTETVFAWPGMGRLMFNAILSRDYPLLMGSYLIMSVTVVLANLLTDIVYAYLDPRVTLG
jgi:peptide/nickel transport system permease protein